MMKLKEHIVPLLFRLHFLIILLPVLLNFHYFACFRPDYEPEAYEPESNGEMEGIYIHGYEKSETYVPPSPYMYAGNDCV